MIDPGIIDTFFSFLYEGRIEAVTFWLQLLAGVASSALVAAIVVTVLKTREFYIAEPTVAAPEPPSGAAAPAPGVAGQWAEVLQKIASPHPADWNLAVIQADAILDGVLKTMGLTGETMGDRLQQLNPAQLRSLNDVWEAHKIRNRIVHDPQVALDYQLARRAVMHIETALRELQYLSGE